MRCQTNKKSRGKAPASCRRLLLRFCVGNGVQQLAELFYCVRLLAAVLQQPPQLIKRCLLSVLTLLFGSHSPHLLCISGVVSLGFVLLISRFNPEQEIRNLCVGPALCPEPKNQSGVLLHVHFSASFFHGASGASMFSITEKGRFRKPQACCINVFLKSSQIVP